MEWCPGQRQNSGAHGPTKNRHEGFWQIKRLVRYFHSFLGWGKSTRYTDLDSRFAYSADNLAMQGPSCICERYWNSVFKSCMTLSHDRCVPCIQAVPILSPGLVRQSRARRPHGAPRTQAPCATSATTPKATEAGERARAQHNWRVVPWWQVEESPVSFWGDDLILIICEYRIADLRIQAQSRLFGHLKPLQQNWIRIKSQRWGPLTLIFLCSKGALRWQLLLVLCCNVTVHLVSVNCAVRSPLTWLPQDKFTITTMPLECQPGSCSGCL